MGADRESVGDKLTWLVLTMTLTPVLASVGSKISSGDWLAWANRLPAWGIGAFFLVLSLLVIALLTYRRVARLRERNLPREPEVTSSYTGGYEAIGDVVHAGVKWRVMVPMPDRFRVLPSHRVKIQTPPRCPQCGAELEEAETFFGSYRWSCIRCSFSVKNAISFEHEVVRAEMLARSEIESPRDVGTKKPDPPT